MHYIILYKHSTQKTMSNLYLLLVDLLSSLFSRVHCVPPNKTKENTIKFLKLVPDHNLKCINIIDHHLPILPIEQHSAESCAIKRIEIFKQNLPLNFNPIHDVIVS